MPLTPLQRIVIELLRPFRSAHDFVGGGAALNQRWPRLSDDMDIFHDRRARLPRDVQAEIAVLQAAGFSTEVTTESEWMVEVILRRFGEETKVQWLDEPETCRRFFPCVEDDELGFRLHQADVAVNKVLCASRRNRAARDAVDLYLIEKRYAPLGAMVWALTGKDGTQAPPEILRNLRTNLFGYGEQEIEAVRMEAGFQLSWRDLRKELDQAIGLAYDYCDSVAPSEFAGHLFIDDEEIPRAASREDVTSGRVRAIDLRDFSVIPKFS